MTPEQKKALEPFADKYAQIEMMVRELSDEEIHSLREACGAVSGTNCWYATFEAAKIVKPICDQWINERKHAAKVG